jgi:hypothetical protein
LPASSSLLQVRIYNFGSSPGKLYKIFNVTQGQ